MSHDLWDIIEDGYEELANAEGSHSWTEGWQQQYKERKRRDANALRDIHQGVSKTIYPRIFGTTKAKDAWRILKKVF